MATFTTEAAVRLKFQIEDAVLVSSELIVAGIDDAHVELLRFLRPEYDTGSPEDALVLGETLLAGARVLRSLASKQAFEQKAIKIGGQHLQEGSRFAALMAFAASTEAEAWRLLEPFLKDQPARAVGDATDSTSVLGEG